MTNEIDYANVADIYDLFVQTTLDVPFFLNETRNEKGEVLELMCGTGRVSLPLVEASGRLVCVDRSPEMLAVLQEKLHQHGLSAEVLCADIRDLDLDRQFDLVLIPFHSFAEITSPADQRRALARIYAHLSETGRFICTLHNPPVRMKSVDGHLQLWGRFPLPDDGALLLWVIQEYQEKEKIVQGLEFFEEYDARGALQSKRMLEFTFYLLGKEEFTQMASSAGFKVAALYGDYAYSQYEEETSPYMIWVLTR